MCPKHLWLSMEGGLCPIGRLSHGMYYCEFLLVEVNHRRRDRSVKFPTTVYSTTNLNSKTLLPLEYTTWPMPHSFLSFPGEVRENIHEKAFALSEHICPTWEGELVELVVGLLGTSKDVHREAGPILYDRN